MSWRTSFIEPRGTGVDWISAFTEDGFVLFDMRFQSSGMRCQLHTPQENNPYYRIDRAANWCGTMPTPSTNSYCLGKPQILCYLQDMGRTPQAPGPNNGFEQLGTLTSDGTKTVVRFIGDSGLWAAWPRLVGTDMIWQAQSIPSNSTYIAFPPAEADPETEGRNLGIMGGIGGLPLWVKVSAVIAVGCLVFLGIRKLIKK